MKRALIIGISGQDGAYLSQLLLEKKYQVFGTSRDAQIVNFNNLKKLNLFQSVELFSMAPNDFKSVIDGLIKSNPDEIYFLAGQSSVGLSFQQPTETLESISNSCLNILEAIKFLKLKTRFYNAGSSECFGNSSGKPLDLSTPFLPKSPYAVAKCTAHWLTATYRDSYDLFACTGVLFNHESPLRPERFVTQKIISAAVRIKKGSNEKLKLGNLEIARDWGWAPDYVEAMWLMLQQAKPQDVVICTGKSHKLLDFVKTTFQCLNLNYINYVEIDNSLIRPNEIMLSYGNVNDAEAKLNWRAKTSFEEIIKNMVVAKMNEVNE